MKSLVLICIFLSGCTSLEYMELTKQEYLLVGPTFPTCAPPGYLPGHPEEGLNFLPRFYKGDPKQNCIAFSKYLKILAYTNDSEKQDELMRLNNINISDHVWMNVKGSAYKRPGIYKTDKYGNSIGPPIFVIK